MRKFPHRSLCLTTLAFAVAACGGGGGGSTAESPAPAPTPTLTLSGTAATGAAAAAKNVSVKCATGTGSATTNTDGTFTVSIANGALPCAVELDLGAAGKLRSYAQGSGQSATVNITPMTELVVANLSGGNAASFFSNFSAAAGALISSTAVTNAVNSVKATLTTAGIDVSSVGDIMSGALVAASGTTTGNAYDKALDALKAALDTSGVSLTTLASTVAAAGSATPSDTPMVATELMLKQASANCPSLRSGDYRMVAVGVPGSGVSKLTFNAATNTWTQSDNSTIAMTPLSPYTCRYTTSNGIEFGVSASGIFVARVPTSAGSSTATLRLGFPMQSFSVADLAGDWNTMEFVANTTTTNGTSSTLYYGRSYSLTVGSNGALSNFVGCEAFVSCAAETVSATLNAPAAGGNGGFYVVENGQTTNTTGHLFAFRAGNGHLMLVNVDPDGSIFFGTKQRTLTMPTVDSTTSSLNFYMQANGQSTAATDINDTKVTQIDANAGSYVRTAFIGTTTERSEGLLINKYNAGFLRRLAGTNVATTSGGTVNVREFVALPLRGMGLTPVALADTTAANAQYVLSIAR